MIETQAGAAPAPLNTGTPAPDQPQQETPENRRRLVEEWTQKVRASRDFFERDFKRMEENAYWATHGAAPGWIAAGKYRANITTRYVNRKVSELYASNPTVVVKRMKEIESTMWDGKAESLMQAIQAVQMGDPILGPTSVQILQEAEQAMIRRAALDKFAETVQLVVQYGWDQPFKALLKQGVRRAIVCGVAWIAFDVYRQEDRGPEISRQVADTRTRVQNLEQLNREAQREPDENDPLKTRLQLALDDFMGQEDIVLKEGFLYSLPKTQNVIVDKSCTQLRGLINAGWIALQDFLTPSQVEAAYGVELKTEYKAYSQDNNSWKETTTAAKEKQRVCVWRIFDRDFMQEMVIADGHPDFLVDPAPPTVFRPGFWPVLPIIFNDTELPEDKIYPLSDVDYLRDPQEELNRAREGIRTHRTANRPVYLTPKGAMNHEDFTNLMNVPTHGVVELAALTQGTKSSDLLVPLQKIPIEPQLYDIQGIMYDFQVIGGFQDANLGPTSGATATESTIAEQSRSGETKEDVDSLDDTLSQLAREVAVMAIWAFSEETVKEMAGPGAVWPKISRKALAGKFDVGIRAGSSGRPNKAMELANFERATPLLQTVPGIQPAWLARNLLQRLDDTLDVDEALSPSLPSITALNALTTKMMGGPAGPAAAPGQAPGPDQTGSSDPNAQGPAGASNAPAPPQGNQGPQPAFGDSGALQG